MRNPLRQAPTVAIRGKEIQEFPERLLHDKLPAMTPSELEAALDEHDALVVRCVRGELTFDGFERAYAGFYQHWALDGHEGNTELLARYESRIALHRRIWEEIETRRTSAEHAENYSAMGFVGPDEAQRRLSQIARESGLTAEGEPTD